MAQWGQGDPRWLVEDRQDGKNVNGWHWEEKSILAQVKSRLTDMFANVECELLEGQAGRLVLVGCKDISGDASITTRKGNKRFAVYDLKMTLDWEATLAPSEKKVTGTLKVDEFASHCEEEDDYIFEISTIGTGTDEEAAKRLMDTHGRQEVLRRLLALAVELKDV